MADFLIGVVTTIDSQADILIQSANLTMETDEYEAKDENGNTAAHQLVNHRVKLSFETIIANGKALPAPGTTIEVPGIVLPTVSASGVVSGTLKIDSSVTAKTKFKVTGTPQLSQSNTEFKKYSMEATHWIVNSLPGADSSD